jgi:hypothetical protein
MLKVKMRTRRAKDQWKLDMLTRCPALCVSLFIAALLPTAAFAYSGQQLAGQAK